MLFLNRHRKVKSFLWVNPLGVQIAITINYVKLDGPDKDGNYKLSDTFTQEV